ncbi:myoD family inhibitor domain-containing protein isoform X4 [Rattus norvegicus]|uniref:myoD family inhibitor domain-containing protein isoform X4 n=1 Tax=Rattus norvegicus TaxID=10116 RepID=UPI0019171C33|nr:myoD family inhibitor domain-containing protein isoform X4 [Rattus norvegicus]
MSGAGEALPPGPVGQQCPAEAGGGRLGSPAHEECNEDTTEKEKRQTTSSHTRCGLIRDQSIWRNPSDGELVRNCCVHCILACLFCEFLTLCNIVLGQASCGVCTSEACCCCCGDEMGDDCSCPCDMDCSIMDACCESSDCLEICMECCGICFPS